MNFSRLLNHSMILFVSASKNEGICSDNDETRSFNCTCTPRYFGERCDTDRCDFYECQNGGTCIVDLVNDIPTPRCECLETHHGAICHLKACSAPCYNDNICDGDTCHCIQENGVAKYYGESCEMPGRDECSGNPCQNGGTCSTTIQDEIQACFKQSLNKFYKS